MDSGCVPGGVIGLAIIAIIVLIFIFCKCCNLNIGTFLGTSS